MTVSPAFGCTGHDEGRDASRGADADGSVHPDAADTRGPGIDADAPPITSGEMTDPGAPQTEFGTKGEAHLFLGNTEVGYIFFAALAPEQADLAHVFFRPEHGGSVNVTDYYVSLVLDRAAWRTGTYSGALAGRAAITLSSGAEYQSKATEASVTATLTTAAVIEGTVYLGGQLTMVLAAKPGDEPLRVEVRLN